MQRGAGNLNLIFGKIMYYKLEIKLTSYYAWIILIMKSMPLNLMLSLICLALFSHIDLTLNFKMFSIMNVSDIKYSNTFLTALIYTLEIQIPQRHTEPSIRKRVNSITTRPRIVVRTNLRINIECSQTWS